MQKAKTVVQVLLGPEAKDYSQIAKKERPLHSLGLSRPFYNM